MDTNKDGKRIPDGTVICALPMNLKMVIKKIKLSCHVLPEIKAGLLYNILMKNRTATWPYQHGFFNVGRQPQSNRCINVIECGKRHQARKI